jgi:uncharacterized protein YndB with AHSA1/START domain
MSKPEFVYITYIETTPEKLFQALTDSAFTKRYWFGTVLRTDWKVGSPVEVVMNDQVTDTGHILEFDPPKRISYSFHHEANEVLRREKPSRATFVLEPYGTLTKLTLIHDDFAEGSLMLGAIAKGWPAILAGLKSLLETGKALAIPHEAMKIDLPK